MSNDGMRVYPTCRVEPLILTYDGDGAVPRHIQYLPHHDVVFCDRWFNEKVCVIILDF